MRNFNKLSALHRMFFKRAEGIDPRVAALKAQRDAIRASAGVTGPGGGTTSGRVFSDGNGGYRVEGAQYAPQAGYNQQGYKTPDPIPGAGGQQNTPPVPRGAQPPPQPVDPKLEEIRKGTAYFEQRNAEFEASRGHQNGAKPVPSGNNPYADMYNQEMAKRQKNTPAVRPAGANPQTPPMAKPSVPAAPPKAPAGNTYAPSRFTPK